MPELPNRLDFQLIHPSDDRLKKLEELATSLKGSKIGLLGAFKGSKIGLLGAFGNALNREIELTRAADRFLQDYYNRMLSHAGPGDDSLDPSPSFLDDVVTDLWLPGYPYKVNPFSFILKRFPSSARLKAKSRAASHREVLRELKFLLDAYRAKLDRDPTLLPYRTLMQSPYIASKLGPYMEAFGLREGLASILDAVRKSGVKDQGELARMLREQVKSKFPGLVHHSGYTVAGPDGSAVVKDLTANFDALAKQLLAAPNFSVDDLEKFMENELLNPYEGFNYYRTKRTSIGPDEIYRDVMAYRQQEAARRGKDVEARRAAQGPPQGVQAGNAPGAGSAGNAPGAGSAGNAPGAGSAGNAPGAGWRQLLSSYWPYLAALATIAALGGAGYGAYRWMSSSPRSTEQKRKKREDELAPEEAKTAMARRSTAVRADPRLGGLLAAMVSTDRVVSRFSY